MEKVLSKEIIFKKTLSRAGGVLIFVILTALGAYIRIHLDFTPVPITLQSLFVLLSGAFLGSSLGVLSQLCYVILGISRIPLFVYGGRPIYILGPTGGYLIGFIIASFLVGRLIKYTKDNLFLCGLGFFLADLAILVFGVIWLRIIFGYSLKKLLGIGFLPFIPGELLKIGFAVWLYLKIKPRLKSLFKLGGKK
ncbi:MAG: biotin transporter BioY [Candidatus Omnitrophica bacterium]|nr:biotin transporter BioY [Candidatus Omnitrophota bacterium]